MVGALNDHRLGLGRKRTLFGKHETFVHPERRERICRPESFYLSAIKYIRGLSIAYFYIGEQMEDRIRALKNILI